MDKIEKKLIIFMPAMEGGGVEKNIILISNYLSKYIKNITLITYDKRFNNKFEKNIEILNHTKNKEIRSKYYKYFFCILILVKQIIKNKNCLIFSFQANIYALMISALMRKKIIIRSNSSPTGWNNNFLKKITFKFFFKFADSIIVNSLNFKKEIDNKFNVNSKLIYNPLNKNEIIKKSKIKIKFNFFKSKKYLNLINISRFTDQKDHITLLKSFNLVVKKIKAKLLIIGYGSNKNRIKNYIKDNKLQKYVKIIEFKENPYPYLLKSDLFLLTSKYEGLPNVLLESMTLKKFIISSNCPTGPREILKNGKLGYLFSVGDHKKLYKLIINFVRSKKKHKKISYLAFKSLNRFDFNTNCNKYLQVVKKLI